MKQLIRSFVLLLFLAFSLSLGAVANVGADDCTPTANPLSCACGAGGSGSTACSANGSDPVTGPNGVLKKVSLIIATIAGIAAVIIIIVAGLQYITSGGDPQKAAGARSAIIGAAVGLVIIAAAESIIVFVVSKL